MPLAERLIVIAFLVQIVWTFAVAVMAGRARFRAAARREIKGDISLDMSGMPEYARKISNNMNNQWESPTLFYALVLLVLVLHLYSYVLAILAFIYVASRLGHTYIHATFNAVLIRSKVFAIGFVALMVMTLVIILDLLTGSII
jgi:hypothetical protein